MNWQNKSLVFSSTYILLKHSLNSSLPPLSFLHLLLSPPFPIHQGCNYLSVLASGPPAFILEGWSVKGRRSEKMNKSWGGERNCGTGNEAQAHAHWQF